MKIYILDQNEKSRMQMMEWLSEYPQTASVEAFCDYIQFYERVEASPPALCLIRLGIDSIPGIKAAEMVKSVYPLIRIVFISDDRNYAVDAYEAGACGYLLCPVRRDKLEKCLQSLNNHLLKRQVS